MRYSVRIPDNPIPFAEADTVSRAVSLFIAKSGILGMRPYLHDNEAGHAVDADTLQDFDQLYNQKCREVAQLLAIKRIDSLTVEPLD